MPAKQSLRIETLTGPAIAPALAEVARLRIEVFREWPYLYDGTLEYEQSYLSGFSIADNAVVVAAYDGSRMVGAATAAPLTGHTAEFGALFARRGLDPDRVFYFGESVVLPHYRGGGTGNQFFDLRETHARACTSPKGPFTHTAFCSVIRDPADPRIPSGYRPLDAFWTRRGYRPVEGLLGTYKWKEIGAACETMKPMQFWMRAL